MFVQSLSNIYDTGDCKVQFLTYQGSYTPNFIKLVNYNLVLPKWGALTKGVGNEGNVKILSFTSLPNFTKLSQDYPTGEQENKQVQQPN